MKKSIVLALLLALSACAAQQHPAMQCQQIGVDVDHPNFSAPVNPAWVDPFYACAVQATQPYSAESMLFSLGGGPSSEEIKVSQQSLQYQQNLWHWIFARQMTPIAAQSTWAVFAAQQESRKAAIRAGIAAAEYQSDDDDDNSSSRHHEDHHDGHSNPSAPKQSTSSNPCVQDPGNCSLFRK